VARILNTKHTIFYLPSPPFRALFPSPPRARALGAARPAPAGGPSRPSPPHAAAPPPPPAAALELELLLELDLLQLMPMERSSAPCSLLNEAKVGAGQNQLVQALPAHAEAQRALKAPHLRKAVLQVHVVDRHAYHLPSRERGSRKPAADLRTPRVNQNSPMPRFLRWGGMVGHELQ
jgi:hypothetical protein